MTLFADSKLTGYSANAIANEFLELARRDSKRLTNMQLQKLVFIAHGYSLALLGRPLTYNNVHAWQFGPVIPKLYKKLQKYGNGEVTDLLSVTEDDRAIKGDEQAILLIESIWGAYGNMTGGQLSNLTHKADTPWSITWAENQFSVIPTELITEYYTEISRR